jgi:hypothetical protein
VGVAWGLGARGQGVRGGRGRRSGSLAGGPAGRQAHHLPVRAPTRHPPRGWPLAQAGHLFGALLFGERLTAASALGGLVILTGVLMTTAGGRASSARGGGGKAGAAGAVKEGGGALHIPWRPLPAREEEAEAVDTPDCERGWGHDGTAVHPKAAAPTPTPAPAGGGGDAVMPPDQQGRREEQQRRQAARGDGLQEAE